MFLFIDNFLNKTTMYCVVLYYLELLLAVSFLFSFFGVFSFTPIALFLSTLTIVVICWAVNTAWASILGAPVNSESTFITALILSLIITPSHSLQFASFLPFLGWAALWAMTSKFIFSIGNKHIFNPAAFAVMLTAFTLNQSASWWIGNPWLMPFVFIGGLLVVKKIKRFDLVSSFFLVAGITTVGAAIIMGGSFMIAVQRTFLNSSLLFFSFIMITEPLTTPPTKMLRIYYGILVGLLFAPTVHIGPIYFTPELALIVGNIFSYIVSPKQKLILTLEEKIRVTPTIFNFVFNSNVPITFMPGQYLEWTLGHYRPDMRGNRRYFTIASSPTEQKVHLGVKFYEPSSSFKRALAFMCIGEKIVASQLSGDFTLPKDRNRKLAFIAGGIGITPFRSMIKYLIDMNEKRNIILMYSNRTADEIAYKEIFDEASEKIGLAAVYAITDKDVSAPDWCSLGFINTQMIMKEIPDYKERTFYISGPKVMVDAFKKTLKELGIKKSHIKIDFFPGFV